MEECISSDILLLQEDQGLYTWVFHLLGMDHNPDILPSAES